MEGLRPALAFCPVILKYISQLDHGWVVFHRGIPKTLRVKVPKRNSDKSPFATSMNNFILAKPTNVNAVNGETNHHHVGVSSVWLNRSSACGCDVEWISIVPFLHFDEANMAGLGLSVQKSYTYTCVSARNSVCQKNVDGYIVALLFLSC